MTLVYGSDIHKKVRQLIKGNVARAGGSVGQLVSYDENLLIQDINIIDGGFGSIKNLYEGQNVFETAKIIYRRSKQEIKHFLYGDAVSLDRKTIRLDMHNVQERQDMLGKFDASISSNVLEHSPNIIYLLLNFHLITKDEGWMFHTLPNFKYTYDRFREPTTIDHFIADFESHTGFSDRSHDYDYIQSAIEKDGWQREFHKKYPVNYPFMHYHVFDEINTKKLFLYIFENVCCDVLKTESYSDNVVLCSNKLNKEFVKRHKLLIDDVMTGKYILS
jgi:hypothetical protein